jgi:hypothetical protein
VASIQSSGAVRIDTFVPEPETRLVRSLTFHPPSGTRVVGAGFMGSGDTNPGLYLIDDDARVVSVVGRSTSRDLVRASARIRELAIATGTGRLAYVTQADELAFVERTGKTLWRGTLAAP